jgi:hypothetical protein
MQGYQTVYQADPGAGTEVGAGRSTRWGVGGQVFVVLSWQHVPSLAQLLAVARGVRPAGWPG